MGIRNKVKEGIADTEHTISNIDAFGKGMREAGQKVLIRSEPSLTGKRWIIPGRRRCINP